jgi:hypothetical protein
MWQKKQVLEVTAAAVPVEVADHVSFVKSCGEPMMLALDALFAAQAVAVITTSTRIAEKTVLRFLIITS